jgi:hypothetical protein
MVDSSLPTPRTTLSVGYVCVLVWCRAWRHESNADLPGLVASARGDVRLRRLRFRCSNCRSGLTDFVVTGKETPRPW